MTPAQTAQKTNPSFNVGTCETTDMKAPAAAPYVKEITAADVVAWLKSESIRLCPVGAFSFGISANPRGESNHFTASGYSVEDPSEFLCHHGNTLEEAAANFRKAICLDEIAASKREQAAKLLAEAELLAPIAKLKAVVAEAREAVAS